MFKLSPEANLDGAITVENKFIVDYMPYADGDYVKVYLYGLSLAARKSDTDDSIARLARRLDIDVTTAEAAIDYWCEQGLMSRLGDEISYFSLRSVRPKIKKYDVDKYREFNRQAQLFLTERQIAPNEYNDYYALMEKLNIEWQAMVLIVKYCVNLKGGGVAGNYILAVARNLAQDGYRTADEVAERLEEYGVYYNDVSAVLSAMGGKRPDHDAIQLYKKWKNVFKFEPSVILHVARSVKRGGVAMLDAKLAAYREIGLFTAERIDDYEQERKNMIKLAKDVNKSLGIYYEDVEPEIALYIKPWLQLGFEQKSVLSVASYCMKKDMRRLSDLDAVLRALFADGRTSQDDISAGFDSETRNDKKIEKLLRLLDIKGAIKDVHRAYYANWTEKRGISTELIEYAASLAKDKANPFAYMNALLLAWNGGGITTAAGARAAANVGNAPATSSSAPTGIVYEKYTEEQLNSLFTAVTEEDE